MSNKISEKCAYDYAELGGLRIALMNLKLKAGDKVVIDWLELRIKELNNL